MVPRRIAQFVWQGVLIWCLEYTVGLLAFSRYRRTICYDSVECCVSYRNVLNVVSLRLSAGSEDLRVSRSSFQPFFTRGRLYFVGFAGGGVFFEAQFHDVFGIRGERRTHQIDVCTRLRGVLCLSSCRHVGYISNLGLWAQ